MDDINRESAALLRECVAELDASNGLPQTMEILTDLLRDVEALRIQGVIEARRHWSGQWDRIGSWLGVSKQGARQRYDRHVKQAEAERAAARVRRAAESR